MQVFKVFLKKRSFCETHPSGWPSFILFFTKTIPISNCTFHLTLVFEHFDLTRFMIQAKSGNDGNYKLFPSFLPYKMQSKKKSPDGY